MSLAALHLTSSRLQSFLLRRAELKSTSLVALVRRLDERRDFRFLGIATCCCCSSRLLRFLVGTATSRRLSAISLHNFINFFWNSTGLPGQRKQ